jgi:hypothetical protein
LRFFVFREASGTSSFAAKNPNDIMKKFQIPPNQNQFAKKENRKKPMQITELRLKPLRDSICTFEKFVVDPHKNRA